MKSLLSSVVILSSMFGLVSVASAANEKGVAKPRAFRETRETGQIIETKNADVQLADEIDDFTMRDWIEKNADRLGLTVEPRDKKKTKPKPMVPIESDPIKTFIIDKIMPIDSAPLDAKTSRGAPVEKSTAQVFERKKFETPVEALESDDAAVQISAVMKDLKYGEKCTGFASPAGFGAWGEFIIDQITEGKANTILRGTDDLRKFCPNYDNLEVKEKSYVWVKVFAAMAFRESTCQPTARGRGPNGRAQGLLQLHYRHEDIAASGCQKFDSLSPLKSLRCGISIVEKQIQKSGRLFSKGTHFGVLRPQGDLINGRRVYFWRLIAGGLKELPFCQRK